METKELAEYVDYNRWLLNSGLVSESTKNNLFLYGSIVHKDIEAVELDISVEAKSVKYRLYAAPALLAKIEKFNKLSKSTSLLGMWRFTRFLKNEGDLNIPTMLNNFVRDFCGSKWKTSVEILDIANYKNGFESEKPDNKDSSEDKLSD